MEGGFKMATHEQMRSLTQNIIGSFEARMAGITSIRKDASALRMDARAFLQAVDQAHNDMAQKQREELAAFRDQVANRNKDRSSEFSHWMKGIAAEHAGAQREWRSMAATLHGRRRAASNGGFHPDSPPKDESSFPPKGNFKRPKRKKS
jgi:hypothetical protein